MRAGLSVGAADHIHQLGLAPGEASSFASSSGKGGTAAGLGRDGDFGHFRTQGRHPARSEACQSDIMSCDQIQRGSRLSRSPNNLPVEL